MQPTIPSSLFFSTNYIMVILAVPRRQNFCKCCADHSILNSFIFLFMLSDTALKDPSIINTIFTFFLLDRHAIQYVNGLYMSKFSQPFLFTRGQMDIHHKLCITCRSPCPPLLSSVYYCLEPNSFALAKLTEF